jgi:enoyl-CoA hydratase/carnithine racemase
VSDPRLELSLDGPIARLTIRRPEKLNALDAEMVDALVPICRRIEASAARVAILTGEGDRSFCAGGDIAAWSGWTPDDFGRRWVRDGHAAFDALARLSQPLIAVLNGHCLGGGLELAACADYRIAEAHVRIGQPEAGLGIIPGWSGTQRATRRFGAQVVRRMALFGEVFGAEEAERLGLVDRVVPQGGGMAAAETLAVALIARSPRATELTKMLVNAAEGEEVGRVLEALGGAVAAASADLREGLAAFREKRRPRFGEERE